MSVEIEAIRQELQAQRAEVNSQLGSMGQSMTKMADSVSDLAVTLSRVEERHARHDDAVKRIGRHVDDHEDRLRTLERRGDAATGGVKSALIIMSGVGVALTLVVMLIVPVLSKAGGG